MNKKNLGIGALAGLTSLASIVFMANGNFDLFGSFKLNAENQIIDGEIIFERNDRNFHEYSLPQNRFGCSTLGYTKLGHPIYLIIESEARVADSKSLGTFKSGSLTHMFFSEDNEGKSIATFQNLKSIEITIPQTSVYSVPYVSLNIEETTRGGIVKNIEKNSSDGEIALEQCMSLDIKGGHSTYDRSPSKVTLKYSCETNFVDSLLSISLEDPKTEFGLGEDFSLHGKCFAHYSSGLIKEVIPTSIFGYDLSTLGNQEVTVTYDDGNGSVSTTYSIVVKEESSSSNSYSGIFTVNSYTLEANLTINEDGTGLYIATRNGAKITQPFLWTKKNSTTLSVTTDPNNSFTVNSNFKQYHLLYHWSGDTWSDKNEITLNGDSISFKGMYNNMASSYEITLNKNI